MADAVMFIDVMAPRAYDDPSALQGLGGTEATLLQIASGLAAHGPVAVAQARRNTAATVQNVSFLPWPTATDAFATLIVINSWKLAVRLKRQRPATRVALWLHVFPGRHNRHMARALRDAGVQVIAVSKSHAAWLTQFMGGAALVMHVAFNPIRDDLVPDATPRDPDLLLFASAPHKGLDQVLTRFCRLQRDIPTLRLAIADPGYLRWPVARDGRGLIWLGTLSQDDLMAQYRRALCLFMPQTHFAETFGLVIAEANAVGCPALLQSGLGANNEVACAGSAAMDVTDDVALSRQVAAWREAPPTCHARPEFRLSAVLATWRIWLRAASPDLAVQP